MKNENKTTDLDAILNSLNQSWANNLADEKSINALLQNENKRLREELQEVKKQLKEQVEVNAEK